MKVTIIGTINEDHVFLPGQEEERISFGGILYNTIRMAVLFGDRATIYPVTRIGREHFEPIAGILAPYPQVRLEGLLESPLGTNESYLYFTDSKNRDERIILHAEPLSLAEMEPFLDSDIIHYNSISGREMDKETFEALAKRTHALLSMDIHNRISNFEPDGVPYFRRFTEWREWVLHLEMVQMNETEASFLGGDRILSNIADLVPIGVDLVRAGPSQALITLGRDGALLVYRRSDRIYSLHVPATSHPPVNTTGCGDAFSSGYLFAFKNGLDPPYSTLFASTVAGVKAATDGLGDSFPGERYWDEMQREYAHLIARIQSGWGGEQVA
jgi:sugar/nucleoside kinase (ribokinase family)